MQSLPASLLPAVVAACVFFVSCRSDDAISYSIPKRPSTPAISSSIVASPVAASPAGESPSVPEKKPDVAWSLPSGWESRPATGMRAGSFSLKSADGQEVDISLISFPDSAGGNLANINRWRGQLGLPPIEEKELSQHSRELEVSDRKLLVVDFTSNDLLIDGKFKAGITAAIYPVENRTWFIKMTGEHRAVQGAKGSFEEFLRSLRF